MYRLYAMLEEYPELQITRFHVHLKPNTIAVNHGTSSVITTPISYETVQLSHSLFDIAIISLQRQMWSAIVECGRQIQNKHLHKSCRYARILRHRKIVVPLSETEM